MSSQDEVEAFDPIMEVEDQVRRDIDTLIHQGYLVESISFGGHTFVLRTLNAREGWAASVATKPYEGTLAEPRVYMAAVVGLALLSYDDDVNFHIKLDNVDQHARKRLNFVGEWDDIVIDRCYATYLDMDRRRIRAREAIEDLSQGDRDSFLPLADSSTELGTFGAIMDEGTPS
jgi:hypothetical protein